MRYLPSILIMISTCALLLATEMEPRKTTQTETEPGRLRKRRGSNRKSCWASVWLLELTLAWRG